MLDCVHGWVDIDPFYLRIIDTPLFQRLGYVRQLTSAQYVFTGANHTRKEHSIGVMHICNKYIKSILDSSNTDIGYISKEVKSFMIKLVSISGLLHDICHGSFSHAWDSAVYSSIYPNTHKGHDKHRHMVLDYFKDIISTVENLNDHDGGENSGENLNDHDGGENNKITEGIFDEIKNIWNNVVNPLSAIVQGPLGADRLDFIKRDSFYTGVKYGTFDIDRIVNNAWFEKININNISTNNFLNTEQTCKIVLVYSAKIIKSALQGLSSRLYMYEEIYLNKTVIAASILIELMIINSAEVLNYKERTKNLDWFVYLNDYSVFNEILLSTDDDLIEARGYADRLYKRKLPKMVSEKKVVINSDTTIDISPGIKVLTNGNIKWTSRVLSKDVVQNFEKYDIHIRTKDGLYTFREYCDKEHIPVSKEKYYFERIYCL